MKVSKGFTLLELMLVIVIINVLAVIAVPQFANLLRKSKEGTAKGDLGTIRSALAIYYSDNEGGYPLDDLNSLSQNQKYIEAIPALEVPSYHPETTAVLMETSPSDSGEWSYDNVGATSGGGDGEPHLADDDGASTSADPNWGRLLVGCTHLDLKGNVWSTY